MTTKRVDGSLATLLRLLPLVIVMAGLAMMPGQARAQGIDLQPIATNLPMPLGIVSAGDGSGRLFIVLQGGRIVIHDGTQVLGNDFLNISGLVTCCGERGLLGLVFHPNYASNGFFYVNYINTSGNTVVARYTASPPSSNVANTNSAKIILTLTQPAFTNHKAGQLQFGPDGYLYIATGDGGSGGDPDNRAQNLSDPRGKILRIDVNVPELGPPYVVPASNPFVGTPGAVPEIWALGLRNPWRFTFDRLTGDMFIADVGQGAREEVNFQPAGSAGGQNYGWRLMEGSMCFNPSSGCNDGDPVLTLPVLEYDHSLGCSITGGFRYRGTGVPSLTATYLYADYCSGRIWGGTQTGPGSFTSSLLLDTALNITTFGEDQAGELYLAHHDTAGAIYRIVAAAPGEIIIDNGQPGTSFTGSWCVSGGTGSFGADSLYSCGTGSDTYRWTPNLPAGTFDVYVSWSSHPNRSTAVPITVFHAGVATTRTFNEQTGSGQWVLHGRYAFNAGTGGYVEVSAANGQAAADAVRFVPAPATDATPPDTSITSGPSGTITTGDATFVWTGSDDVTPTGSLVYATRLEPQEGSFSAFAAGTSRSFSNLANGTYTFHVMARDQAGNVDPTPATRTFTVNVASPSEIIIDNGQAGTSFTGSWCVSGGTGSFGADSLYSCGTGSDTYRWTPNLPAGTFDVYVWWSSHPNRSTTVPITVFHAGVGTTRTFNEQTGSGQWVLHGRYAFNAGTGGYVEVTNANGQAAADAVRFVPAPAAPSEVIIDNGQPGTSFTGSWCVSSGTGFFGPDSLYSCGTGADTYRWSANLTAGTFDVYVWWSSHPNRSTTVPITVFHGGVGTTQTFNQQTGSGQWVLHGRYAFDAGTGGYVETSAANGQAAADAARFVPVP